MTLFTFTFAALTHLAGDLPHVASIASDIADVSISTPINGDAVWTASILAVTAWRESRGGEALEGDEGMTCGAWHHWSGYDRAMCNTLKTDSAEAARVARNDIAHALEACADKPRMDRLAFYVSGSCDRGIALSHDRMNLAAWLLRKFRT